MIGYYHRHGLKIALASPAFHFTQKMQVAVPSEPSATISGTQLVVKIGFYAG